MIRRSRGCLGCKISTLQNVLTYLLMKWLLTVTVPIVHVKMVMLIETNLYSAIHREQIRGA